MPTNVLGTELRSCCRDPMTGFYRDGCCRTGPEDIGQHTVCIRVTREFLDDSVFQGNDLVTPLAGLIAGLEWSPEEVVFVFAVDMPFAVDAALLDALEAAIKGRDAAVPTCGGQPEPLCALFRKAPALQAGRALLAAQKGPSALLSAPGPRISAAMC